jgi:hypothetical protein
MASTLELEGEAVAGWATLLSRLIRVARPGALYPDAARLLQLLDFCTRVAPKKTQAEVIVSTRSGLPAAKGLEKLTAMREVAANYLRDHGAKPSRASHGWSTTLAAAELPPLVSTQARLVSKTRGGPRRFLVVHERWEGALGCPARYTFHLSDASGRYVGVDKSDQAQVKDPLRVALEVACRENAELAFLHLGALEGVQVGEVVMGQVGPFEAPYWVPEPRAPLSGFLQPLPATGVLHLVLERAASDIAADMSLDPFVPLEVGPEALQRRAALGFHVSRERRLCCPAELQGPLQAHLATLGASLIVRAR